MESTASGSLFGPSAAAPARLEIPADSYVEMTWQVFRGDAHEIYLALLLERCERDGLGTSEDVLSGQLRLHLHRGIGYLAAPQSKPQGVCTVKALQRPWIDAARFRTPHP
jgi:DNA sulfur modification protein DndE